MNRLFRMKVPVKNYSDVDWFRQFKNTELTHSCNISCLWLWRNFLILSRNCRCKKKTHWVSECTTVCVCTYIEMVFWNNTVQTAIMFSVTNSRYFKRNCECLFSMKVPVKNYSDVDWFRQVKNTELNLSFIISCLWLWRTFLILSRNCRCKRKTHWVSECTTVCVCVHTHWHGLPRQHSSNSHYVSFNKE